MIEKKTEVWGLMWYSKNKLDGITKHIIRENCLPVLFTTKSNAKKYRKERYGYIAVRKDLRAEPFGWELPKIVKMQVKIIEEKTK